MADVKITLGRAGGNSLKPKEDQHTKGDITSVPDGSTVTFDVEPGLNGTTIDFQNEPRSTLRASATTPRTTCANHCLYQANGLLSDTDAMPKVRTVSRSRARAAAVKSRS